MAIPELPKGNPEGLSYKTETLGRFRKITVGGKVEPKTRPSPEIGEQTRQLLAQILPVLEREGTGREAIYRSNILLCNRTDFGGLNTAYGEWLNYVDKPTRFTTVTSFPDPATLVEIQCIAIIPNEVGARVILKDISTPNAPPAVGPYAQGKRINFDIDTGEETRETIITSGQIALDPRAATPTLVSTEFDEQATQTFANVQAILEAGNTENVSRIDVVLTDARNEKKLLAKWSKWSEDYGKPLPEPNIIVGDLLLGALVEVSAVGKRVKRDETARRGR